MSNKQIKNIISEKINKEDIRNNIVNKRGIDMKCFKYGVCTCALVFMVGVFIFDSNKVNNIKPITSLTLEKDEKDEFESLVDKFLQTNNTISKGYEKSILNTNKKKPLKSAYEPNESGFDLNEALNPTDDLTNIMKGFKLD